jgi:hypothetical protein
MWYVHKGWVQKAKKFGFSCFFLPWAQPPSFNQHIKTGMKPQSPATAVFVWCRNRKLTSNLRVLAVATLHLTLYFQQCYSPTNTFLVQEYIPLCNPQWTVYKILNRSSRLVPTGQQGVLRKTAQTWQKMKEHKPASWPQTADCLNFWTALAACVH